MSLVTGLLGDLWPWLVGAAGVLLAIVGLKRSGKKEARLEDELEGRRTRDDVEEDHAGDAPDARRGRVSEWER